MGRSEYQAVPFSPDLLPGVADLMRHLWGSDPEENVSFFRWKYEQNPHTEDTLAIVALRGNTVVGFRGFFATKWAVGQDETIGVLCPCDTCVHPDHRRKGLSVWMGEVAMRRYGDRARFFLNTSCSSDSLPGYFRLGFVPLAQRRYLTRLRIRTLLRSLPIANKLTRIVESRAWLHQGNTVRLPMGQGAEFVASDRPLPEEMARIVARQGRKEGLLTLCQDQAFFRWRFSGKRRRYLFCYMVEAGEVKSYAVILLRQQGRGIIIDYGGFDEDHTKMLLESLAAGLRFDMLSIWDFSAEARLRDHLESLGFQRNVLTAVMEKRLSGEVSLPLLVRPARESFQESDWRIQGLDVRRIQSWLIKGVCSDAL